MTRVRCCPFQVSFLLIVSSFPATSQPTAPWTTIDIPASFAIKYPAVSPSSCYRVARPANGRITASVTGPGTWEVCIGDQRCPDDCFDSGQRTASTERLTDGTWYYVRVISKSPGIAATLNIAPTGAGGGGSTGGPAGLWCVESNPNDCLRITVTGAETVTGSFVENGAVYAEATGYFRGSNLAMAFRRTNRVDVGFVTFIFRNATRADARTFNPDGSQRWAGAYVKR
jgi:hypothetical protein